MNNTIDRKILIYTEATGFTQTAEMVHGTLFVRFKDQYKGMKEEFRKMLKEMMNKFINSDTGVNGNVVGDEIAYDFVPAKDETEWNKSEPLASVVDNYLNLEEGK